MTKPTERRLAFVCDAVGDPGPDKPRSTLSDTAQGVPICDAAAELPAAPPTPTRIIAFHGGAHQWTGDWAM